MALATRSATAPARAHAAGFASEESCAFIDTLFAVAEAGRCKFAFDARDCLALPRDGSRGALLVGHVARASR
jgi:hypothetical protein